MEGDPAGVAPHHLDDQHPVVAVGGRVQAVDRLHRDVDRGVEAEGVVGGAEVVVDRLRHPDHRQAVLVVQARRRPQGVLAADRDQAVDPRRREVRGDPLRAAVAGERVGPRGAEDGAAAGQDAAHLGDAERHAVGLQRPPPAVAVADELVPVVAGALADDRADHRVQARAIAAAGEHSDPHRRSLVSCRGTVRRRRQEVGSERTTRGGEMSDAPDLSSGDPDAAADLVGGRLRDGREPRRQRRRNPDRGARDRPRRARASTSPAAAATARSRRRGGPGATRSAPTSSRPCSSAAASAPRPSGSRSSSSRPTPRTCPSRTPASTSRCRSSARCSPPTRSAPRPSCCAWSSPAAGSGWPTGPPTAASARCS